jgi:hypothetical protein
LICRKNFSRRAVGTQGDFVGSAKNEKKMPPRKDGSGNMPQGGANVGEALRAVYRDAVAETIPDEMLDLLNKLA